MATADRVRACFAEIASRGPTDLIIDARQVGFIDSTGLHALVEGKRLVHEAGGRIALVPSVQVRRLFELALPQPVFETRVDTVGDAYATLGLEGPA